MCDDQDSQRDTARMGRPQGNQCSEFGIRHCTAPEPGTSYLDSIERIKHTTSRVEGALPLVQGLETVHHGTIATVRGGYEEEGNPTVESNETLVVRPLAVGVKEMMEPTIGTTSSDSTSTHC
jgi:hypothetical protein